MGETARDAEWTPSDASASARRRSVEVGLDVGRVSFDFQNDDCGEKESCKTKWWGNIPVRCGERGL